MSEWLKLARQSRGRVPIVPIAPKGRRDGAIGTNGTIGTVLREPDTTLSQDFEEHAAVAEFDGGLSRPHAECLAALQTIAKPSDVSERQMAEIIDLAARRLEGEGAKAEGR